MVLAGGRRLLGVDHAGAYLASAAAKFPSSPPTSTTCRSSPYQGEFDGVLYVDGMEVVLPEDWPPVLERLRRALRSGGWLYLTVELAPGDRVRAGQPGGPAGGAAGGGRRGHLGEPDGYYHHYPNIGIPR
jgi:hypothetical protein